MTKQQQRERAQALIREMEAMLADKARQSFMRGIWRGEVRALVDEFRRLERTARAAAYRP